VWPHASRRLRGASLVELVVAIVVLGVAATAALGVLGRHVLGAPDALQLVQAQALAQALLDEALAQPAADTDPDGGADAPGPEAGEARGSPTAPFDHVNDYDGLRMDAGILAFDGSAIAGLEGYRLAVSVTPQAVGTGMSAADGWWVAVRVTTPGGAQLLLEGLRARLDE
jgi:MSHA pilin protein MshD